MGVNPGERYPKPTTAQQVTNVIRNNSASVAFVAGQVTAIAVVLLALLVAKVA